MKIKWHNVDKALSLKRPKARNQYTSDVVIFIFIITMNSHHNPRLGNGNPRLGTPLSLLEQIFIQLNCGPDETLSDSCYTHPPFFNSNRNFSWVYGHPAKDDFFQLPLFC